MHERRAGQHQVEGVANEPQPLPHRLGDQRQAGNDRGRRLQQQRLEQAAQAVGIALHQRGVGIARTQDSAERRIEFDQHEPRRRDSGLDQRLRNRPGPGAELDDRPVAIRIDIARHGARKHFARRRHRADGQRPLDPGADEAHLVVEPDAALALELPDLLVDLLADIVASLPRTAGCGGRCCAR